MVGILWNRTSVEVFDKLSSTAVDFIRSEGKTGMHALIWSLKCLLSMLRCMLGSVKGEKSENPKGKGEIGKKKRGGKLKKLKFY